MSNLLFASVIPTINIGDAVQSYVGLELMRRFFRKENIFFMLPDTHVRGFNPPLEIKILPMILNFRHLLNFKFNIGFSHESDNEGTQHFYLSSFKTINNIINVIKDLNYRYFLNSQIFVEYIVPALNKALNLSTFNACLISGHTITVKLTPFSSIFNTLRVLTRGPIITMPISISTITLEKNKEYIFLFKKAIRKLDIVFVRGPHTLNLIRKICDKNIYMSLDSAFAIKILYPEFKDKVKTRGKLKIAIVPRSDYFVDFELFKKMYVSYVKTIKTLVVTLNKRYDVDIHLISHHPQDLKVIRSTCKVLDQSTKSNIKVHHIDTVKKSIEALSNVDLIVTSRLHAGIIGMSFGVPAIFFMPSQDTKVLDVLDSLSLDKRLFLVDLFNSKEYASLAEKVITIVDNLNNISKLIESKVESASCLTPIRILKQDFSKC